MSKTSKRTVQPLGSTRVCVPKDSGHRVPIIFDRAHQLRVRGRHRVRLENEYAAVRFAAELCYDVTVVKDATADYSDDAMHAALDVNMTNYAAIMTTNEVVESMASLVDVRTQSPGGGS